MTILTLYENRWVSRPSAERTKGLLNKTSEKCLSFCTELPTLSVAISASFLVNCVRDRSLTEAVSWWLHNLSPLCILGVHSASQIYCSPKGPLMLPHTTLVWAQLKNKSQWLHFCCYLMLLPFCVSIAPIVYLCGTIWGTVWPVIAAWLWMPAACSWQQPVWNRHIIAVDWQIAGMPKQSIWAITGIAGTTALCIPS